MSNINWDKLKGRNYEEIKEKLKAKDKKIRELFIPDRTVSEVLKMLRGLNGVKPMPLNEAYKYYGVNSLNPLEELADGMCYEFPKKNYDNAEYLIQRNDENIGYVIDIDETGI